MQKLKKNSNIFPITIAMFVMVFIIIGTLNSILSSASIVGMGSLMILFYISSLGLFNTYVKKWAIPRSNWIIAKWGLIHFIISVVNLLYNYSSRGVNNVLQFFICISFFLFVFNIKWNEYAFKILGKICSIYIITNFFYWISTGRNVPFMSIYSNPNVLGSYILFFLFFVILGKHYSKKKGIYNIGLVLGLFLIIFSNTRSAMLACLVSLGFFLTWRIISKSYNTFKIFFWLLIIIILSFVFIYPLLPMWSRYSDISNFIFEYTGKNILSGRNIIWETLLNLINSSPLFGFGPGTIPSDITSLKNSSHNLFLQITLQNGYIGLITFLFFLSSIWKRFWLLRASYHTRLAAAFFAGMLIHQSFEIALTQNQLSVGIIQWLIIGIGISNIPKTDTSPI